MRARIHRVRGDTSAQVPQGRERILRDKAQTDGLTNRVHSNRNPRSGQGQSSQTTHIKACQAKLSVLAFRLLDITLRAS